MNWKQLLLSTEARLRLRARHEGQVRRATRLAASPLGPARPGGWLVSTLAAALDVPPEVVVLHRRKQGMYAFQVPGRYVRAAQGRAGRRWLEQEQASWQRLVALGLADLVSPGLDRVELPGHWRALADAQKLPIALAELPAALAALVPPMVERGQWQTVKLPATIAFGHAVLEAEVGIAQAMRLPPLETLEAALRRPQRVGFFHVDLKDDNIMRLGGRYCLNDLRSCSDGRLIDLELLKIMVRHYPKHGERSSLERLFAAVDDGWRHPAIAPLAECPSLPRELWGPVYLCHVIGQCHGLEKRSVPNFEDRLRALVARPLLRRQLQAALEPRAAGLVDLGPSAR